MGVYGNVDCSGSSGGSRGIPLGGSTVTAATAAAAATATTAATAVIVFGGQPSEDSVQETNEIGESSSSSSSAAAGGLLSSSLLRWNDYKKSFSSWSTPTMVIPPPKTTTFWTTMITNSTTTSTTTTLCEGGVFSKKLNNASASTTETTSTTPITIKRKMTNVGRFSLLSETSTNPSIPVLVLCLKEQQQQGSEVPPLLSSKEFIQLYQRQKIDEKHERFHSVLESDPYHHGSSSSTSSASSPRHFVVINPSSSSSTTTTSDDKGREDEKSMVSSRVHDMVVYPQVYRNELKTLIHEAVLKPMDLTQGLWEAWIGSGGTIGQSGAIPKTTTTATTTTTKDVVDENVDNDVDEKMVESLLLFRAHHCLADGVSLATVFADLMDEGEEFRTRIEQQVRAYKEQRKQQKKKLSWWKRWLKSLQFFLYFWCWGTIRAISYQLYLYLYSLFIAPPNPWKLLQQHHHQQQQSTTPTTTRTLSWVEIASVDDVKKVADYFTKRRHDQKSKKQRQKMTVNDIFCSCITGAIVKLMNHHRQREELRLSLHPTPKDSWWRNTSSMNPLLHLSLPYLNLVIPVHMTGGILLPGSPLGNKIGAMVNQVPGEVIVNRPSDRLYAIHETLWNRKQTPAAILSYLVADVMGGTIGSWLGPRVTSWFFSKAHGNASVVVTNVRGPDHVGHFGGRTVETTLGFLPLPPGIPIGVVVMSYNQKMTLTVMAESWAVPDADQFLSWIVEEYEELAREAQSGGK